MRPQRDLTGQRFGRLVAVHAVDRPEGKNSGTFWLCKCDCGNDLVTRSTSLLAGLTASCGCSRRRSYPKRAAPPTPSADSSFEVLRRSDPPSNEFGHPMWRVRCQLCGEEFDLNYNRIGNDRMRCKCQGQRPRSPKESKPSYHIWHHAKRGTYVVMDNKSKWIFTSKDKAKAEAYLEQLLQQPKEN